jgi:hypothetical protein
MGTDLRERRRCEVAARTTNALRLGRVFLPVIFLKKLMRMSLLIA